MSSTFFGLNVAYSGLNAFQASINTTANNVSNVETKGYSKQVVNLEATSALRAFQKYGSVSTGVAAISVTQLRDKYYDQKYWNNQSSYGNYNTKYYYMQQIEDLYTDSAATEGFTTIFTEMFNSLDGLKTNAADSTYRQDFITDADKLCKYFNSTSTELDNLQSSLNDEVKSTIDQINTIAQKIALLNKQINTIEVGRESYANDLRDERALLLDELSQIVSIDVIEDEVEDPKYPDRYTGLTICNVKLNGQLLVDNYEYNTLMVETRDTKNNISDIEGLYDIKWSKSGIYLNLMGNNQIGSLRALIELRDGNDDKNLTGRITDVTGMTVKITNPSITTVETMNLAPEGKFTVKGVEYEYKSFDVETDNDGNITSFTFNLKYAIPQSQQAEIKGSTLSQGSGVNYKGVPYYQNEMNTFLRSFAKNFNDIEKSGETLYEEKGESLFVAWDKYQSKEHRFDDLQAGVTFSSTSDTYYYLTAANVRISNDIKIDQRKLATAPFRADNQGVDDGDLINRLLDLQSKTVMYRGGGANTFLESIYADVTVDTKEASMFEDYYKSIQTAIQRQRDSVAGVDEDEEAMDLVKFQNAYNLSSKVISVLAEMYDQLILNTGV